MLRYVFVLMTLMLSAGQVCGGVIVSVQSGTIAADGYGYVDVYIRSSSGAVDLYSTSYLLEITGATSNGKLIFRDTLEQTTEQQTVSRPVSYVFLGDTDTGNWFATRQTLDTELSGGDSTLSGSNVLLDTTDSLLARLQLQHISDAAASAIGDTFTIAVKSDPLQTYFWDSGLSPLDIDNSSYTSTGTFTIIAGATAVPEPAGILASIAAVTVAAARYRRRGRV